MPANLSPEYSEAERKYKSSATDEERLAALREMLRTIPKHKGTEKMQADIKTRISRANKDLQSQKGKARRQDPSHVRREGAGQAVLVGAPNAGKSALVAAVTNATPEVADYPFTTQKPQPAMMPFENIQIQLVDAPAVSREYTLGWLPNLVRNTDLALLVADAGNDACLENVEAVLAVLEERHVRLVAEPAAEARVLARTVEVPTLLVVAKMDREGAADRLEILREFYGDRFELLPLSTHDPTTLSRLRARVFAALSIIRVISKAPGREPEAKKPFVLPAGSTVTDFARAVHRDLAERMRYARLWGEGKFDGQRVPRDHELSDLDIVEINA